MHRLVCSGYATPEQTGWDLMDSFTLDVILDVAYGEVVHGMNAEQKEEVDKALETVAETPETREAKSVPVTRRDGTVVHVSPERWNRLMSNRRATRSLDPRQKR